MALKKESLAVGILATIVAVLILVIVLAVVATQDRRAPPQAIIGLIATDTSYVRNGQIDLVWSPSDADDFLYYAIYASETEITDITELSPVGRIDNRTNVTYQVTRYRIPGVRLSLFAFMEATEYWFVVTAVDLEGNESKVGTSVSATIEMMPPASPAPTVFIKVTYDRGFQPGTVTVPIGTTVAWSNFEDVYFHACTVFRNPHTVTSDTGLFHGELTDTNNIFSYTFTEAGVFDYHDQLGQYRPWTPADKDLTGTVIVVEEVEVGPGAGG